MLFNSVEFLFGFLIAFAIIFHIVSRIGSHAALMAYAAIGSLVFYAWWDVSLLWVLLTSISVNYLFSRALNKDKTTLILWAGILFNLAMLGWFKYAHFVSEVVTASTGVEWALAYIALPLGISFFTFQQIAFLVDVHGGLDVAKGFVKYSLFVVFFPQLIAGPIVHSTDVMKQYDDPKTFRITPSNLAIGLTIFSIGLFKKTVIADSIAMYPDRVFEEVALGSSISFVTAWVAGFAFVIQVYFDFSGYSDMAIGLARIFGIVLPQNFNSPLKARSMIDFWQRWHITLTSFLNTYVFNIMVLRETRRRMALGLSVKPKDMRRPAAFTKVMVIPAMITMLLIGVWHGAGYQFFIFGLLNGVTLIINHAWRLWLSARKWTALQGHWAFKSFALLLTLATVTVAFVIFRAEDYDSIWVFLAAMSGGQGFYIPESYANIIGAGAASILKSLGIIFAAGSDGSIYPTLSILVSLITYYIAILVLPNTQEIMRNWNPALHFKALTTKNAARVIVWQPTIAWAAITAAAFVVGAIFMLRNDHVAFVYFQF